MSSEGYRLEPRTWAVVICLIAFTLLVCQLDAKSLWVDETLTMYTTEVAPGDLRGLVDNVMGRAHPPIYFLCIWIWKTFAGDSELALRFPSVIFGMLSIAMLYPLGTKMMSKRVGLMAMSLMAISPFFVLSSRIAQYYSLLLLLSLVSYWFFNQLLDGADTGREWTGYVITSTLGIYTHYLFAFVLAAQAVVAITRIRRHRQFVLRLIGSQMIMALLVAPWVSAMMGQAVRQHALPDPFPTSSLAMWVLSTVHPFFAWSVGETLYPWNPAGLVGVIAAVWLACRGLLSVTGATRDTTEEISLQEPLKSGPTEKRPLGSQRHLGPVWTPQATALSVFILLPLLLTVFTVKHFTAGGDPFPARRAVFCAPFLYLLIAKGLHTITRPGQRLFATTGLAMILGLSLTNYYLGREFHNPTLVLPTRAIADMIDEQSRSGDVFISDPVTAFAYYIERKNPEAVHFFAYDPQAAKTYIAQHQSPRVWLVLLCRAIDAESLATVELVPWLLSAGYSLELTSQYAPLDDAYARVQELILRKPACGYKVMVHRYAGVQRGALEPGQQ